ncbi:hypothetical protein GCM10009626_38540 [Brachybacterium sacelli]
MILEQRICNACYSRLRRHPGRCPSCGYIKVLAFYDPSRQIVCAACAGVPPRFACTTCGGEEQLTGSQCGTCRLTARLRDVLADGHGGVHRGLTSLYDHLLTARDPRSVVRWLRRNPIGETLRAMATDQAPISHTTLDALPPSPRVRYLRRMLISAGTLPAIDVRLNDLENFAATFIADLPAEHAAIVGQYFNWEVFRKLRQRSSKRTLSTGAYDTRATDLRKIANFLYWITNHGLDLPSLSQATVDRYFAGHSSQAAVGTFLNWAVRRGLTGPVTVPRRTPTIPSTTVPDDTLWSKVDLLIEDDSIPLSSRIIGLLALVFAQRLSDCVRLHLSDITAHDGTIRIAFGTTPLTLPEAIADLLSRHLEELSGHRPFVGDAPEWLFPGATPQHHTSEANVALHLARHRIQIRKAQQARIDQLVQQVPASIVADTLGISINTAIRHAARTNATWGAYPELRATPPQD